MTALDWLLDGRTSKETAYYNGWHRDMNIVDEARVLTHAARDYEGVQYTVSEMTAAIWTVARNAKVWKC